NRTLSPDQYHFRLPFYADITIAHPMLIDQNFDHERTGAAPVSWKVSAPAGTEASVVSVPGIAGNTVLLRSSADPAPFIDRPYPVQEHALAVEWQWKETVAGQGALASLSGGSAVVVDLATRNDAGTKELVYRASDGTWKLVQAVADDTWYSIKVIIDP